jgi:P4 family phage/plasmid primase-like protien
MFEFLPSHTLVIVGNHKPGLRAVDEAMRSRIHLIEFGVTIPEDERDTELPEKLKAEYPGIMAWALQGCLDWQDGGLKPPAAIKAATENYLACEDSIEQWIAECCERRGQITLKAAHSSYKNWCESNSQQPLGRNTFADQLEARGFRRVKDSRNKVPIFHGLMLPVPTDWREFD